MTFLKIVIVVLILFSGITVQAIGSDRLQPISVNADFAQRNEVSGLTVYRGNVIIRQGTILIEADKVTIHYKGENVSQISCLGSPASYQQQSSLDESILIARADTLEYLMVKNAINLKTNASLSLNGTYIKGDSINYDLSKGTWKAQGDNQGTQKRIQLVIPPFNQTNSVQESSSRQEAAQIEKGD